MTKRTGKIPTYASMPLAGDYGVTPNGRVVTHLAAVRAASPQAICPHCFWPTTTRRRRVLFFWTKTENVCRNHGVVRAVIV